MLCIHLIIYITAVCIQMKDVHIQYQVGHRLVILNEYNYMYYFYRNDTHIHGANHRIMVLL